jgi:DNA-binding PadR family transcriptional regulator
LLLKDEFESRTGEVWPLNVGQVYATLQRLARDELVIESDAGGDVGQRLYELTGTGRTELERWLMEAPASTSPPRDELVIKVLVALTVPGLDVGTVIQNHRRQLVETLQRFTRMKTPDADLAFVLVADAEIFRCEAAVRWLDACETRLGSGGHLRISRRRPGEAVATRGTHEPAAVEAVEAELGGERR